MTCVAALLLRACCISTALRAGTHDWLGCRKNQLVHLGLPDLCPCVDDSANESDDDCCDASECDGCGEKDESTDCNRKFVESSDHRVSGRGRNANAPCRAVRDEDRC